MEKRLDSYLTIQGSNCVLSSIANALSMFENSINDAYIFFLMDGLRIKYGTTPGDNSFLFSHHFTTIVKRFLEVKGISYSMSGLPKDFDMFKDWLISQNDKGFPFVLYVKSPNLTYSASFVNNRAQLHVINIIGYKEDAFLISDCFVTSIHPKCYEGFISFEQMKKIWEQDDTGEYTYFNIDYELLDKNKLVIKDEEVLVALQRNIKQYFDEEDEYSYTSSFLNLERGIREMNVGERGNVEKVEVLTTKLSIESVKPARILLIKCLKLLMERKVIPQNQELLERLEVLVKEWSTFSLKLIKAVMRTKPDSIEKAADYLHTLVIKDREVFKAVEEAIAD